MWVSERESFEIPARGRIAAKQFEETVVIVQDFGPTFNSVTSKPSGEWNDRRSMLPWFLWGPLDE